MLLENHAPKKNIRGTFIKCATKTVIVIRMLSQKPFDVDQFKYRSISISQTLYLYLSVITLSLSPKLYEPLQPRQK